MWLHLTIQKLEIQITGSSMSGCTHELLKHESRRPQQDSAIFHGPWPTDAIPLAFLILSCSTSSRASRSSIGRPAFSRKVY
jgi:hypothetical protein